jgi:hypothetical protein
MIPVGYMAKCVTLKPDWLESAGVKWIHSISNHVSTDFCEYIQYWKHNGFWLFDSPDLIRDIAATEAVDLSRSKFFYYEAYEQEYDEDTHAWNGFDPEQSFTTEVVIPQSKELLGFDVVTFSCHTSPECSPLACNSLANQIPVNQYCLMESFEQAKQALEAGWFDHSEPGPFRIFAVYALPQAWP